MTMKTPPVTTNAVKFGKYAIVLEKEQLSYYSDGEVFKVVDVNHEFTNAKLFELATNISRKNDFGPVNFCHKNEVVKRY